MRAGEVVGGGPVTELPSERIAELMVGHRIATHLARADRAPGDPLLKVRGLQVADDRGLPAVRGVSFEVHAGEIVGIAGVEGNGQHELVECIAGLRRARGGTIEIAGPDGSLRAAGARSGLAHIPSDRLRRGLVPAMTVAENLILGLQNRPEVGSGPWLDPRRLDARAASRLADYDVRPRDPRARAGRLSGGNQQKLIAARELERGASVVLAAHPTRGVDLGATAFLHARLLAQRDQGRAILLVSSELSEILSLADRILVLYEGTIAHQTRPADTDERTLGLHMTGRRETGAA
jgi:simple sugar transport system ATP-binding protein